MSAEVKQKLEAPAMGSTWVGVADGVFAGWIGAATLALFFLGFDVITREALWTPGVVSAALLTGVEPASVTGVDLGLIALFSALHAGLFTGLGALVGAALMRREAWPALWELSLGCGVTLHAGVFIAGAALAPDLVSTVGAVPVLAGNLLAGFAMARYLLSQR